MIKQVILDMQTSPRSRRRSPSRSRTPALLEKKRKENEGKTAEGCARRRSRGPEGR